MFLACAHGDKEKVKELVKKYGTELLDVKEPTKGTTPLHFAVIAGKPAVVKTLIKLGCDINAVVRVVRRGEGEGTEMRLRRMRW